MFFKQPPLRSVLFLVTFFLVSCIGNNSDLPTTASSQDVNIVGGATPTFNNLDIRLDWVEIGENVGDLAGDGEVTLELLVIRGNGDSRVLTAPGRREYKVSGNNKIILEGFSLTVNEVGPDEKILVYLIAFDNDELSFTASRGVDLALGSATVALEDALQGTIGQSVIAGKTVSNATLLGIILSTVTGGALDWWEQAEMLGGFGVLLEPQNNWQANSTSVGKSDNENLHFQYSILSQNMTIYEEMVEFLPEEEEEIEPIVIPSPTPTKQPLPPPTASLQTQPTSTPRPPISRLWLVNADNNQDIYTLATNSQINLSALPTGNLDIRAEVNANWVESVIFFLDGLQFELNGRAVENTPPYSMAGDLSGDFYNNWNWGNMLGNHTISVVACSQDNGRGNCSNPFTITISVSN